MNSPVVEKTRNFIKYNKKSSGKKTILYKKTKFNIIESISKENIKEKLDKNKYEAEKSINN
jgi:hypothetical protein